MKYTRKQLLEASKIFEALQLAGIDIVEEITFNDETEFTLENGELTIDTKFTPIIPLKHIEVKAILTNDLGLCVECKPLKVQATKDYNGCHVCERHWNKLNDEFDEEYA